jgi:hypothetical protein
MLFLNVDLAVGGMEQRKIHMLARTIYRIRIPIPSMHSHPTPAWYRWLR